VFGLCLESVSVYDQLFSDFVIGGWSRMELGGVMDCYLFILVFLCSTVPIVLHRILIHF
jgi:hypothetical protein